MSYTIAFIGDKPLNIFGYNINDYRYKRLSKTLSNLIEKLILTKKANRLITGGAVGFDTLMFFTIKQLQVDYNIEQILAIPFAKQPDVWPLESIYTYNQMKKASTNVYVDSIEDYSIREVSVGEYHPGKMDKRNLWMIDNCDMLVVCWKKSSYNEANSITSYAKSINKELLIIDPLSLSLYSE